MNFKSADSVISRVNKVLSSFVLSGQIDEGDFYDHIKYLLMALNIPAFNLKDEVLDVINYKAVLPDDFQDLHALWVCKRGKQETIHKKDYQNTFSITYEDTCYNTCVDSCGCSVIKPTDFKTITRDVFYEYDVECTTYNETRLLTKKKGNCVGCSKNNINEYDLIGTNGLSLYFEEGSLLLQYYAFEKDSEGFPLIPDLVQFEKALESYLIYKSFQQIYYNGLSDVRQRMYDAETEYNKDFQKIQYYINLPSWSKMVEYAKKKRETYKELIPPEVRSNPKFNWWYRPNIHPVQSNYISPYYG